MAAASPYGRGLVGLWRQGWDQIPAVMGSTVLAVIGAGLGFYSVYRYEQSGQFEPRYKTEYVIYRPDDPRNGRPVRDRIGM